jgi:hypothetical protein
MRDALIATNVIEPAKDGPKVLVQIGVRDCDVQVLIVSAEPSASCLVRWNGPACIGHDVSGRRHDSRQAWGGDP